MLFPIHTCCLEIVNHLLQERRGRSLLKITNILEFMDILRDTRIANGTNIAEKRALSPYYSYGNSGGLEWSHNYFGARRFWGDGWDTEPGWEVSKHSTPLVALLYSFLIPLLHPVPYCSQYHQMMMTMMMMKSFPVPATVGRYAD